MNRLELKKVRLERRKKRVKYATQSKDPERKRLIIIKTNRYLYAQIVDNTTGKTLLSVGTFSKAVDIPENESKKNIEAAKKLGHYIAKLALERGITKVYLDRRGRKYTGKIAAFADAAREAGLQF
ncbi:MAG: 50S ribosomal protein L18 [Leptospiraceae bacterium]|nr:50S ribosomal protein L18 [Leptospiraceae bacterium]MDW7975187.1 50S ribosomal protein L18 [Leptospiraceae bacterium]